MGTMLKYPDLKVPEAHRRNPPGPKAERLPGSLAYAFWYCDNADWMAFLDGVITEGMEACRMSWPGKWSSLRGKIGGRLRRREAEYR